MTESERLAGKGIRILQSRGWPEDAIEEIVTTLMAAGMARWAEQQMDEAKKNEALILKVAGN